MTDINVQAAQQGDRKGCLNSDDRGERINALPRPNDVFMLCVGGH